jgi:hypothetical protein
VAAARAAVVVVEEIHRFLLLNVLGVEQVVAGHMFILHM